MASWVNQILVPMPKNSAELSAPIQENQNGI